MAKFRYHSTEKHHHNGKRITKTVKITGGKGYKSVTMKHGRRNSTKKQRLHDHEIEKIKNGKFIRGLFRPLL